MKVRSFAKINLGLEIVRKRPDGYHDIRTLFQSIDLADTIELEHTADGSIRLEGDEPSVAWDGTNLVFRAALLLRERTGSPAGARIRVAKAVPPGKGLGGGSSNAAVTLLALNKLWSLGLGTEALAELALLLGSDVPYFLQGGLCLGESRGEALKRLPDLPPLACVLAFPPYPILTAGIYAGFGASLTSPAKDSKIVRFLDTGDFGLLENDLELVIFQRYPELEAFKRFFRDHGAALSLVTGSGSAVFGLFTDRNQARKTLDQLRGKSAARLVETLPREGYWAQVGAGA
ncbi:MAG: 4-(cytidine 5'-diphospho)-2-C-methyl-D-erythritol kinase [Candidatus Aminicenantales bacterium]|jgi:4-diphosphocytidyl-2-C-methyl-D-erythritol kinase